MLKNISPLLNPEVLHALASMGHGDEILIADANFPAAALAARLCRMDIPDAVEAVRATLSLMPLDQYVDCPVAVMAVVGDPAALTPTEAEFQRAVDTAEGRRIEIERLERHRFYERARKAFAIIATGETRLYGNILLKKGVVGDTGNT